MARYLLDVANNDIVVVSEDDDYTYTTLIAETADDEQGIPKPAYEVVGYTNPNVTIDGPTVAAFGLEAGTAKADTTGKPSIVYVQITGGTAGTVEVQVAPAGSSTFVTLVAATSANAVESQVIPVPLPPYGQLKVSVSVATVAATVQYTVN